MDDKKLQTACLGLHENALELLAVAAESDFFDIVAVGARDIELAEKTAETYQCAAFDDYRQMLVQNKLDVLIVAAELSGCSEFVRLAISKNLHILKLPPPGQDFAQAEEMADLADKHNVNYISACFGRFAPGFERLSSYLENHKTERIYFIDAFCPANASTEGPALLHDCFELLDQLVLKFSLPQQIYALVSSEGSDKKHLHYLGEDAAAVSMNFAEGLVANLITCTGSVRSEKEIVLRLYSKEATIVVSPYSFCVYGSKQEKIESKQYSSKKAESTMKLLADFAESIIAPSEHKISYSSKNDLATMALIEAIYLSARTAMPETPSRILEI